MVGESKMSKSLGNVIYADDMVHVFGVDAMRYIFLHEMPFAQDGHITYDLMMERINSDLANNMGNLVNRTISMQNKYFNGIVANPHVDETLDTEFKRTILGKVTDVKAQMEELRVQDAIGTILELFSRCNKYIDETMPWSLAKDSDQIGRLATVLYNLLEAIRIGGILLRPFLPETSAKILANLNTQQTSFESCDTFGLLETDIQVVEQPEILFQRLNEKDVAQQIEAANTKYIQEQKKRSIPKKPLVDLEDFSKLDLKVAKVLTCQRHPNADKLFVLTVDLGGGDIRQIVSGLAQSYMPGQVIGKRVVVIANLKPVMIRGLESKGMLLAGKEEGRIGLVEVNGLEPGTIIS